MRHRIVIWFVLLTAGFLTGFILQYARQARAQQELSSSISQLRSCQSKEQLAQLGGRATLMYLEAAQKNYGKAAEYSKEFFDQAQQFVSSKEDMQLQNSLRGALANRDKITADLAKGDAAVVSEIQPFLSELAQSATH